METEILWETNLTGFFNYSSADSADNELTVKESDISVATLHQLRLSGLKR
jgi:hypothetical protein